MTRSFGLALKLRPITRRVRRMCEVLDVQSGRAALLFGSVAGLIVAVSFSAIVDVCIFHGRNDVASTSLVR